MNIFFIEPDDTGGGGYISRGLYRHHILMEGYKIVTNPGKADIVHGYGPGTVQQVVHYGQKYNIPMFMNLNGIKYSPSMSYYRYKYFSPRYYRSLYIVKHLLLRITHFFTLNEFFKSQWVIDGVPSDRFSVIPNMIDESFPVYDRSDSDVIRMLYIGEQSHYRLPLVAQNVYKYLKKIYDCSLTMIYDSVKYRDMPQIYQGHDIYLQPMKFPICTTRTLIESMSYGLCPVVYGFPEFSPIIENKKSGILVDKKDSIDWINVLIDLFNHPDIIKDIGQKAKDRVWKVCHPDRIIKKYIDAYEGCNI